MKHTKEPWFVEEVTKPNGDVAIGIASEQFDIVCVTLRKVIRKMEDAERIVACVNACEGITTEALESGLIEYLLNHEFMSRLCPFSPVQRDIKDMTYLGEPIFEEVE